MTATGATASAATIAERAENVAFSGAANVAEGDGYQISVGSNTYTYVAGKNETIEDVAKGLKAAVDGGAGADISTQVTQNSSGQWMLKVDNNNAASASLARAGAADGTASGGLFGLDSD